MSASGTPAGGMEGSILDRLAISILKVINLALLISEASPRP